MYIFLVVLYLAVKEGVCLSVSVCLRLTLSNEAGGKLAGLFIAIQCNCICVFKAGYQGRSTLGFGKNNLNWQKFFIIYLLEKAKCCSWHSQWFLDLGLFFPHTNWIVFAEQQNYTQ